MRELKIIFNSRNKKGRGCRIRNGNSSTLSDYLYDGNNLRVVKDSDGTLRRVVVWYGDTPVALIDIEQSEPTFYACTTTESFTDAAGPGMTIDTAAHSIVIQDGDYAGTYAISDEDWQVYPTAIVFSWRGGGVEFQGGLYPDYELPRRSGGLIFYEDDDEGNSQIADIYKVWKQSESGSSTIATPYQVHTDQIGAPVLLTDTTGTAVWSAQYAPFGHATINSDVDGDGTEVVCNLRFPGQYFDAESGLHYNWHRYYEPRSGRYITLDPIGLNGGDVNCYRYVGNNSLNWIDREGLWSFSLEGYYGLGGGFVFGKNPEGGYFLSFRYGRGVGGGLGFDPEGTSPGWDPCDDHGSFNVGVGGYAGAGVALGPAHIGISGNAGVNVEKPGGPSLYYGGGFNYGLSSGWKLRAGAAAGGEITFY